MRKETDKLNNKRKYSDQLFSGNRTLLSQLILYEFIDLCVEGGKGTSFPTSFFCRCTTFPESKCHPEPSALPPGVQVAIRNHVIWHRLWESLRKVVHTSHYFSRFKMVQIRNETGEQRDPSIQESKHLSG